MIDSITLKNVLPKVFEQTGDTALQSEIWLQDVTFAKGEKYLIEAASGTGKTSLCTFLMGMRRDYIGSIAFDAEDVKCLSANQWSDLRKCSLAWMPQELGLFPKLTVMENIDIKNRLTGYLSSLEIETLLHRLGIDDKKESEARYLSIGQQQRVAFIRMLCQPADFFIVDEPVSHLDDDNKMSLSMILGEVVNKTGAGVIMTSVGNNMKLDDVKLMKL